MSNDYNSCTFTGRLGQDPETRNLPSGEKVTNFSVACGKQWKDKSSGENKQMTEWVRCVAFGRLAEVCAQYLKKGTQVLVNGELRTKKWTDKNNIERFTSEIFINQMKMLGTKADNESAAAKPAAKPAPAAANQAALDDDIPF